MANEVLREISLDVAKENTYQTIIAKQYDKSTRYVVASIVNQGEPMEIDLSSTITINFERPRRSGEQVGDYKAAFFGSFVDGKVKVPLPYWALERDGEVSADISLLSDDKKLTTLRFSILVQAATYSGDDIKEDDEYDVLMCLLEEVKTVKAETQEIAEQAVEATKNAEIATLNCIEATQDAVEATKEAEEVIKGYPTISLVSPRNKYLLVLGEETPAKIEVEDIYKLGGYGFKTQKALDRNALIGAYQFVEKS